MTVSAEWYTWVTTSLINTKMYTLKYSITSSSGVLNYQLDFSDIIECTDHIRDVLSLGKDGSQIRYWVWKDGNSFNLIAKGKEVKSLYGQNE